MKPSQLLILVAAILVVRLVLTLLPVAAGSTDSRRRFAREYLDPFIVAGLAAFLLITFVGRTYYIPSASMVPTLQVHDVLLVDKVSYRFHPPHDEDIVVFPPPIDSPDDFIKRVMAAPGDTFRVTKGVAIRNGVPVAEPYIAAQPEYDLQIRNYGIYVDGQPLDPKEANIPPKADWIAPDRVPPHCYFMMGDNRNDSDDSHAWGFAQDGGTFFTGPRAGEPAGVTGRAFFIFWPLSDAKML
jgi:signal peptidase I